ncbi:hypothetical protein DERP_008545 [Dermatophagoides pteronyssinus]|uniref:Uncharacterized protein n=1 Tax=Dermatophagoides pteronyssinus TaxID=6956 RepID=A0ABQ8IX93_DERPT|nr:hypothetical protein DERP_008545 [Dermatophagoides pteronyssinus]
MVRKFPEFGKEKKEAEKFVISVLFYLFHFCFHTMKRREAKQQQQKTARTSRHYGHNEFDIREDSFIHILNN